MGLMQKDILSGLHTLGLRKGNLCMVHSSFKSLGFVENGVSSLFSALRTCVGDSGTIVVPTLTGTREDGMSRKPSFDVTHTKGWTGLFSESLRTSGHAVRSLHPTHSVAAIGKDALTLTQAHHFSHTPCDVYSPYVKLIEHGGYILLIGVDLNALTLVHACEEYVNSPYHLQGYDTSCTLVNALSQSTERKYRLHNWDKPKTNYNKVYNDLKKHKIITTTAIGKAQVHLISCRPFFAYVTHILHLHPNYFIE